MIEVMTAEQLPPRIQDGLRAGVTRFMCPKCNGGQGHELSLSARPAIAGDCAPIMLLNCFRNSCGWKANVLVGEGSEFRLVRSNVHEARVLSAAMRPISIVLEKYLLDKYGLPVRGYDLRGWAELEHTPGTLVMPVVGPHGEFRGHMTRSFDEPKICMSYKQSAQPWQAWYINGSPKLLIVEDQISAVKIYQTACASSVALLGTNLTIDKMQEIARVAKLRDMRVSLALDPDATSKAFALRSKYLHIYPMAVLPLSDDAKDIATPELIEVLDNV